MYPNDHQQQSRRGQERGDSPRQNDSYHRKQTSEKPVISGEYQTQVYQARPRIELNEGTPFDHTE